MTKFICDKCNNEYKGNYCPTCGDKRTTKDQEVMTDSEIIKDMIEDASVTISKKVKKIDKITICGFAIIALSVMLFFIGFYYKITSNGVILPQTPSDDIYNLVINSNYFSGFMSLSSGLLISGVLVLLSKKKA